MPPIFYLFMNKPKLKILFVSEASFLSSGFGIYMKEIISRLYKTNKYDIAEFASYGFVNDPRDKEIQWKYYANAVKDGDPRHAEYNSRGDNQFGRWRFEKVLLDFKPDIVCDVRDYWMSSYQALSPLRKYFHWVLMPTVDSAPQQEEWIDTFLSADSVFTYSDWGADVLKEQSSNKINYIDTVSPGVDLKTFYPNPNKKELKQSFNIDSDSIIFGSVMRNQKRKLIPELIISFRKVLDRLEQENYDLGKKLYLYLHTSYPDAGWDIPELLKENRLANKVLFTYLCRKCSKVEASVFVGPQKVCKNCLEKSMTFSSVTNGVSTEQLATVYNLFDVYIQYSICLGKDEPIRIKRNDNIQWLPISQAKVGDQAWTHKNRWKPITNVWKNLAKSHNKKVMEISLCADYDTLLATENHEFPAYTSKELSAKHRSVRENIGYYLYNKKELPEPGKYELNQLKNGDILSYPIDDTVQDIDQIDIAQEIDCSDYLVLDSFIETGRNYAYPRYINIDNDFCKFMGLFAADGSYQKRETTSGIKITSHINESDNHEIARSSLAVLSSTANIPSVRIYKERLGRDDALWSALHANLFSTWFSNHENRCLPEWSLYLSIDKQKNILQGLFMGDGHFCKERNVSIYTTISRKLADQIKHILRRLRIQFNVGIRNKKGNRKPQYRFEIPGNIKDGEFLSNIRTNSDNLYYNNQHLMKIKKINEANYKDDVWCVTVEDDHTMMTKIGATFQCEGFGCPQTEAGASGLPIITVDYSAMCDIVNKLEAVAIKPGAYFKELETRAIRVYPDNNQLVDEIIQLASLSSSERKAIGDKTRSLTEQHYNWDDIAKKWENHLDYLDTTYRSNWDAPPEYLESIKDLKDLNNSKYFYITKMLCEHYLKDNNIISSSTFLNLLQNVDYSFGMHGAHIQKYDYQDIIKYINTMIDNHNQSEHARANQVRFNDDFIQYAKIKSLTK